MSKPFAIVLILLTITAAHAAVDLPTSVQKALPAKVYGHVTQVRQADLDKNGVAETIAITRRSMQNGHPMGGEIIVLQKVKGRLTPLWRQKNLNPWKLCVADVNGDGKQEIIAGVWKKSPKDPIMARRTFVFYWNGTRMMPMWLGSRLSRRFVDFDLKDINKDGWAELLAMEIAPGKPNRIGIYRWKSFGFEWLGSAEPSKWKELTK